MPSKPLKPCNKRGCPKLTRERYCEDHKQQMNSYDKYRESSSKRGYDSKWRKARLAYLQAHPLCVKCLEIGIPVSATVVDHIIPHRGDYKLFWNSKNNWQPLCKTCHDRKTAAEDGGFGNNTSLKKS
jgi:5-methylcytosine-specific restriction protein A